MEIVINNSISSQTIGELINSSQNNTNKCVICNKSFKKVSHFNRHMNQKHSESRSYVCEVKDCQKQFKRSSHLKRHMISHTHEKGFKCTMCIMSFGYKHHLDRHVKVIHLKQKIVCTECGEEFIKRKAYQKHFLKMHKNEKTGDQNKSEGKKTKKIRKIRLKSKKNVEGNQTKVDFESECQSHPHQITPKLMTTLSQKIYNSDSDSEDKREIKSQKQLYRCSVLQCVSAFTGSYELKRHLQNVHKL